MKLVKFKDLPNLQSLNSSKCFLTSIGVSEENIGRFESVCELIQGIFLYGFDSTRFYQIKLRGIVSVDRADRNRAFVQTTKKVLYFILRKKHLALGSKYIQPVLPYDHEVSFGSGLQSESIGQLVNSLFPSNKPLNVTKNITEAYHKDIYSFFNKIKNHPNLVHNFNDQNYLLPNEVSSVIFKNDLKKFTAFMKILLPTDLIHGNSITKIMIDEKDLSCIVFKQPICDFISL